MPLRTSLKPWTAEFDTYFTYIRDANGDKIGKFNDHRDADSVIDLHSEIERLEQEITELEWTVDKQVDEINNLKYQLAESEKKL